MVSRMLRGRCALVLFEKGTLDHHLPVALRYGNNWTFQQDNGTPHTQEWHFLTRIHGQRIESFG